MSKNAKNVDMKKLQVLWEQADIRVSEFANLPDGNYTAKVFEGVYETSKSSNRLQVSWGLRIAGGDYNGKVVRKFEGLETKESMGWLKGTMSVLGVQIPKKIANVPKAIAKFFDNNPGGVYVDITVAAKDGYSNIYINGKADELSIPDSDTVENEESEDLSETVEDEEVNNILEDNLDDEF